MTPAPRLELHQDLFILLPAAEQADRQMIEATVSVDLSECGFTAHDLQKLQTLATKLEQGLLEGFLQVSDTASVGVTIHPK